MENRRLRLPMPSPLVTALLYTLAGCLWIVFSSTVVSNLTPRPELQNRVELVKGLVFVVLSGGLIYFLLREKFRPAEDMPQAGKAAGYGILVVIVLLILLVPALGLAVIKFTIPIGERQLFSNLETIAEHHINNLQLWREERIQDLNAVRGSTAFLEQVRALADNPRENAVAESLLRDRLSAINQAYDYKAIHLVDPAGNRLLSVGDTAMGFTPDFEQRLARLANSNREYLDIKFLGYGDPEIIMDFTASLRLRGELVGFLVYQINSADGLYQRTGDIPVPYETTEILIANRLAEGAEAIHIRQPADQPPELRRYGKAELPLPAQVFSGNESGRLRVTEPDGRETLLFYQQIPGSNWLLAVKVARSEALQPIYTLTSWLTLASFIALTAIAGVLLLLWRQQQRNHRLSLLASTAEHEHALREQEKVYIELFKANPHPMWLYDLETLEFLEVNDAAIDHYGYSRDEFLAMTIKDIRPPEDVEKLARHISTQPPDTIDHAGYWRHCKKDGTLLKVEISSHQLTFNGRQAELVLAYDMTAQLEAEEELRRLNSYYAAVSEINSAIVRSGDADTMLFKVCQIIHTHTRLWMVTVSRIEADVINPGFVIYGGSPEARQALEGVGAISIAQHDRPGLSMDAVRQNRTIVVNDYPDSNDDGNHGLRVNRWGLKSMVICPIRCREGIWGLLNFCSTRKAYFTPQLVELLEGLTNDVAYALDMLELDRRREEAEAQLVVNARIIESTHEGLFITDMDNRITLVNQAMTEITGYSRDELTGSTPAILNSGRQGENFYHNLWETLDMTDRWEGEIWDRRKNGEIFPAWLSITRVHESSTGDYHHIAIYRDITERKEYERRIEHLANHDILTDLPNRFLLEDRTARALAHAKRQGTKLALLFIDLDNFKLVNDTLGHDTGDRLLQEAARRITHTLRESDTISRVGGDEFIALILDVECARQAEVVAEKIIDSISSPFTIGEHSLLITASIGVALYPDNADSLEGLTRLADIAMINAKQSGHNRYHFYSGEMGDDSVEHLRLLNELRQAVPRNQIYPVFQPQFDLASEDLIGLEALARWKHPDYGEVSPVRFIPVAEDSGVIIELGNWMLMEVCRQAETWRQRGLIEVPVSVNVSALQFRQPDYIESINQALDATGLPASLLSLELTESMLIANIDDVLRKLSRLNDIGVKIAIDDFGTGYSSLSYLRQFSAHLIKIDKSFIRDLPDDLDARAIANAVVSMGNTLGMGIIAEGVETEHQANYLSAIGCRFGQGFYFARPMTAGDLEVWLGNRG